MHDHARVSGFGRFAGHDHHHFTFLGELDGIGDQVADALAHADGVEFHPGWHARVDEQLKLDAFLFSRGCVQLDHAAELVTEISGHRRHFQLASLDLRQVQNVVQDRH